MAAAIGLRADFGAEDLRRLATAAGGDLRARVTNGHVRGSACNLAESCGTGGCGSTRKAQRGWSIIVGTWRAARAERENVSESEVREALLQLDPLWDELFPAEQGRIVQLLVERIDVSMHGVQVRLRPNGLPGLVREVAGGRRAAA
jgi:hypothetical protein